MLDSSGPEVEFLRFLLGVEVVEVAEPLIEAMHRGQKLVTITQMILAELRRGIPDRLEHLRQGGIFLLDAAFRTRDADPISNSITEPNFGSVIRTKLAKSVSSDWLLR